MRLLVNGIGRDSGAHRCGTVCIILRRVMGTLDADLQSHAAIRIATSILESVAKEEKEDDNNNTQHAAQQIALLCSTFTYVSPRAKVFADAALITESAVIDDSLVVKCIRFTLAQMSRISTIADPDSSVQADHLLSLLLNKVQSIPIAV